MLRKYFHRSLVDQKNNLQWQNKLWPLLFVGLLYSDWWSNPETAFTVASDTRISA